MARTRAPVTQFNLQDLENIIAERAKASAEASWTARLVKAGQDKDFDSVRQDAVFEAFAKSLPGQ